MRYVLAMLLATLLVALTMPSSSLAATAVAEPITVDPQTTAPLTNLDHLDWLGDTVTPPEQDGHTTYRLADEPSIGTLWTYAEPDGTGAFRHVGGGTYNPATNTYGQGAYNADDISRAAVVYVRHWQATGSTSSRDAAYVLLRGLTYLQTATGPNAGNVVLWMQPDGTLNKAADPPESPSPSDSDASYWLARTIWALGESYAAFQNDDPAFAKFLRTRLDLAIGAVDRQVLDRYREYLDIDGQRTPAWLIADGADATAEAVLGLSAYVSAGGPNAARKTLSRLGEGVAAMSDGDAKTWPFGAIRPWVRSRSVWHGWGALMPAALSRASTALQQPGLAEPAATDSFTFDPWLLTSGGPDNGHLPTPIDRSQIAYGVDSRLQSLVATGETTHTDASRGLAGMVAAWYFGANPAGEAMYDPQTGRTFDGISGGGNINHNSGAESTIHGLMSMIVLDENPDIAALARTATIDDRVGTTTVQGEDAQLSGNAASVQPAALWTGESQYGGTGYAALGSGGTATFTLSAERPSLVLPVFDRRPGSLAVTTFRAANNDLGTVRSGDVGAQGDSPAPGALLPTTLAGTIGEGVTQLTATAAHATGDDLARLDAVMLRPLISRLVLSGDGHGSALLSSASDQARRTTVTVAGTGIARIESYTGDGRLVAVRSSTARAVPVTVPGGGFVFVRR